MPVNKLQHYWRITGIAHIMLFMWMLFARSTSLNTVYLVLICSEFLLVVGSGFFIIWLNPLRLERLRLNKARYRTPLAIIMLVISFGIAITFSYFPHYTLFALLTPLTFGLLLFTLYEDTPMALRPWMWITFMVLLLMVIGVRIYSLSAYPAYHRTDEGWAMSWGVHFALTGERGDPLMDVPLPSYNLRFNLLPRFTIVQGLWQRLIGIGYWETRLFSFLCNLIITALTTATAYNWYGKRTALFTAVAMVGSVPLMQLVSTRPDSGYVLALATSLYLASEADKLNWRWLYFVAGTAIGLGAFSHLNAVGFGIALAVALFLPRYITDIRQRHRILPPLAAVLFALGGALSGILVFIVLVLPNPEAFLYTISSHGTIHQHGFAYSLVQNILQIYIYSNLQYFLIFLGLIACILRRQQRDWVLFLLVVMLHIMLSIMAPYAYEHYMRPMAVIYALAIGALLARGDSVLPEPNQNFMWINTSLAVFVLIGLVVHSTLPSVQYLLSGGTLRLQPTPAITWIEQHINPEDRLLAPTEYALWLPTYTNMRSLYIEALQNRELWLNLPGEQIWDAADARFIVFDSDQRFDMLPKSLFASDYLRSHNYIRIAQFLQEDGLVIIYARQNP